MRTVILLFVFMASLAGVQQVSAQLSYLDRNFVPNLHLPLVLRSKVPATLPTGVRLLAEATTSINDSTADRSPDSVTYTYTTPRQTMYIAEGCWLYDKADIIDYRPLGRTDYSRYLQSFNSNGEVSEFENQRLNSQNTWISVYKEKYTYLNGKMASSEVNGGKDTFIYDINGQLVKIIHYTRASPASLWKIYASTDYQYGVDGITNITAYDLNTNPPTIRTSEDYTYGNGKLTEILTKRNDGTLINNRRHLLHYTNSLVDSYYELAWHQTGARWDTLYTFIPEYDNNNRDTAWMAGNHRFALSTKITHMYDANGLIVKVSGQRLKAATATWEPNFERRFYYGTQNLNISNKQDNAKKLSLYPVPASQYLNIDIAMPVKQELQLAIYQADGRTIRSWNQPAISTEYKEQIDLSSIPAGNYILQVNSADGKITKQFSVIR